MKIDSVTHFTDEIGVVEISTFRDDMIIVLPPYFKVAAVSVLSTEQTVVQIIKPGTEADHASRPEGA